MGKLAVGVLACVVLVVFISCGTSDPNAAVVPDFQSYSSWTKVNSQPITGDSTGALGRAHEAAEGFREVYVNRTGEEGFSSTGEFPQGTIIVKEAYAESDGEMGKLTAITVMVKREDGFDSSNGNWEYVNASADLKIRGQGAIRSCIVCHAQAENDYIFANY